MLTNQNNSLEVAASALLFRSSSLRLIARITSIASRLSSYVLSKGTKSQISLKKLDVKNPQNLKGLTVNPV